MRKKRKIADAVELMDSWYGGEAGWDGMVAEEELSMQIGQAVYDLREAASLTQKELAELAGTTQSIISKVENADYGGSSLEVLRRVCLALHCSIKVACANPGADGAQRSKCLLTPKVTVHRTVGSHGR